MKRQSLIHWIAFVSLSKISWLYLHGSVSRLSILFCWSICLLLTPSILIIVALWWVSRLGCIFSLSLSCPLIFLSHLLLRWNEMWDREIQFWIRNQLHPRTFLISGEFFLDFIPEIDKERGIRLRKGFCAFFPSLVSLVFSCSPVTLSHITWYLQLKIKNNTLTHRWKAIFLETQGAKSAVNKLLEEN